MPDFRVNIDDYSNSVDPEILQKYILSEQTYEFIGKNKLFSKSSKLFTIKNHTQLQLQEKLSKVFNNSQVFFADSETFILPEDGKFALHGHIGNRNQFLMLKLRAFFKGGFETYNWVIEETKKAFKEDIVTGTFAEIMWAFDTPKGTQYAHFSELLDYEVHSESYPYIDNFSNYHTRYMNSRESLLFLKGRPGTGKTKFISHIIQQYASDMSIEPSILYVTNKNTLGNEDIFINFMNGDAEFLILEDVDEVLKTRKDGNDIMSNLLTSADGLISNLNKKIVVTTNLPNLGEIDEALLRPGRCYDTIEFRSLGFEEAQLVLNKLSSGTMNLSDHSDQQDFYLSQIYKIFNDNGGESDSTE